MHATNMAHSRSIREKRAKFANETTTDKAIPLSTNIKIRCENTQRNIFRTSFMKKKTGPANWSAASCSLVLFGSERSQYICYWRVSGDIARQVICIILLNVVRTKWS